MLSFKIHTQFVFVAKNTYVLNFKILLKTFNRYNCVLPSPAQMSKSAHDRVQVNPMA